jgi:hypothetical protein
MVIAKKRLLTAFFICTCFGHETCSDAESAPISGVSLLQSHFLGSRLFPVGEQVSEKVVQHRSVDYAMNQTGDHLSNTGGTDDHDDTKVQRRLAIEPMFYIHVPKCGSSFATALAHLACGDKIDINETVREPGVPSVGTETWNSKCGEGSFARFDSGHLPMPEKMTDNELSKVVMMVRAPKSRISSGYIHNFHDCGPLQTKYNLLENAPPAFALDGNIEPDTLEEYAICVQSCTVNMLTGRHCAYARKDAIEVPSEEERASDVKTAISRLRKFGFVGLTDQWDLSICLWHAKFGGECIAAEFENLHEARVQYDEGSFPDSLHMGDQDLYDEAAELFAKEMEKYGVSPESCAAKYCPEMAHLFGGSANSTAGGSSLLLTGYTRDSLEKLTWPGRMFYDED